MTESKDMMTSPRVNTTTTRNNEDDDAALQSPQEKEIKHLLKQKRDAITDVDIQENSDFKLRFRKFPFDELRNGFGVMILSIAVLALHWFQYYSFGMSGWGKFATVVMYIVGALAVVISGMYVWDTRVEEITFDKRSEMIFVTRYELFSLSKKTSSHPLKSVCRVHAARREIVIKNSDKPEENSSQTVYLIIVTMDSGQELKVLQTENPMQIRKELIVIRKFLKLEDEVPCIYDEMKRKPLIDQATGKAKRISLEDRKRNKLENQQKRQVRQRMNLYGDKVNFELRQLAGVRQPEEGEMEFDDEPSEHVQVVTGDCSDRGSDRGSDRDQSENVGGAYSATQTTGNQPNLQIPDQQMPKRQLPLRKKEE